MASDFDWTAEAIVCLRAFWDEGLSTAEIGRRMQISKNAVVGKAHRLRLPPRPSPIREKGTGRPRQPAVPRLRGPSLPPLSAAAAGSVPSPRPPSAPARPSAPAPQPQPATVFRPLAARHPCCWPSGEPGTSEYRTCDGPSVPGKPYCAEHASIAYVTPQTARGRPDGRVLDRYFKRELTRTT